MVAFFLVFCPEWIKGGWQSRSEETGDLCNTVTTRCFSSIKFDTPVKMKVNQCKWRARKSRKTRRIEENKSPYYSIHTYLHKRIDFYCGLWCGAVVGAREANEICKARAEKASFEKESDADGGFPWKHAKLDRHRATMNGIERERKFARASASLGRLICCLRTAVQCMSCS